MMSADRSRGTGQQGRGRLIGYARVSTHEQVTDSQMDDLRAAGCDIIFQDIASGSDRSRPQLAKALQTVGEGDTLIVVRFDRLARSLLHLLEITNELAAKGAFFRSLRDPFDNTTPHGPLMMQVMGAFAEFERQLIRDRTRAGIAAAKARGAKLGNPKLRARDPVAIAMVKAKLAETHLQRIRAEAQGYIDTVLLFRPHLSWEEVCKIVNRGRHKDDRIHVTTLKNQVRRLVKAGDLSAHVLERAKAPSKLVLAKKVFDLKQQMPDASLRGLAAELDRRGVHPPRGEKWSAEAVRRLLIRSTS